MVSTIDGLAAGFRRFWARYYDERPECMRELVAQGQSPAAMVIACSDSRVDPALLFGAEPGELFVVRNVANLVPPYAPGECVDATSAALEFAVCELAVRDIVVVGHSGCGGIAALRAAAAGAPRKREFIMPWMELAADACRHDADGVAGQQAVECAAICISLANLATFPWVARRIGAGELALHGWWVDLATGRLYAVRPDSGTVELPLAGREPAQSGCFADG